MRRGGGGGVNADAYIVVVLGLYTVYVGVM